MAEQPQPKFIQCFVKIFQNETLTLQFPTHQTLTPQSIKHQIESLTQIPIQSQTLTLNGKTLTNSNPINPNSLSLTTITLNFSLLGGKGGFGSLLRGAATKAGQKKTNNFDACRDMSGRRLRHVNAEKRLEEWRAEEEERKMEKMAEDYLKKMEKKGKGGKKEEGAEKYVELYREQSRRCVEEVERSVRESLGGGGGGGGGFKNKKRKVSEKANSGSQNVDAKKLKIWMGKKKVGESDSDDSESDDSDVENEKSVVTENGNHSDSSKDTTSASVSALTHPADNHSGGSSESGSEEEKEIANGGPIGLSATPSGSNGEVTGDGPMEMQSEEKVSPSTEVLSTAKVVTELADETTITEQLPSTIPSVEPDCPRSETIVPELHGTSEGNAVSSDEGVTEHSSASEVSQPLNLDNINSAAELEVLGMEKLKSELQARGLKCGGTLQERAARLFLLKTTPLEKLPKKLFAKK